VNQAFFRHSYKYVKVDSGYARVGGLLGLQAQPEKITVYTKIFA